MNFTRRKEQRVLVRQIPLLLLGATALFSLPFLAFSLVHIVRRTDAEGKWFTLFLGLFMAWLFLEFVATREKFEIDLAHRRFARVVCGVFRRRRQSIDLKTVKQINLEIRKDWRGRRHQYLFIRGEDHEYLVNTPGKTLNHEATGRLLSEITGIPFSVTPAR